MHARSPHIYARSHAFRRRGASHVLRRRQSTANTRDTQSNRYTPDFVVGAGVTTSTIARAAHDTFVEDRLHLNGVCRRSKWPRGLRHNGTHTHARARTHTHHLHAHTHKLTYPPVTVTRISLSARVCVCVLYCFLLSS